MRNRLMLVVHIALQGLSIVALFKFKTLYYYLDNMKARNGRAEKTGKTVRTRWDPRFDCKPSSGPIGRFVTKFSSKYIHEADHILDAGCGVGSYLHQMTDRKGCFGIDLDAYAIKIANKYCINSEFSVASVLDLPFRDNTFNIVTISEVIEHLPSGTEKRAISEIYRILTHSGMILLSTPNYNFLSNVMDPAFLFYGHRHYKIKKLMKLIIDSGFSIEEHAIRGGLSVLLSQNVLYFNKHILHRRGGRLQVFVDNKSDNELNSNKAGLANIFIAAKKIEK
jgi:2-polyprenyl-3-methyl-5-hydroxy-6-metoxy-1,4-benzoquinol methylase